MCYIVSGSIKVILIGAIDDTVMFWLECLLGFYMGQSHWNQH